MSVKVASNRFIVSSLRKYAGFYQQLFKNVSDFQTIGSKLIREAEAAQAFRQINRLEELGTVLSNFPLSQYQIVGHYYQGWCSYRKGGNSRAIFENVIEQSDMYRAKALISLAALEARDGNYASEFNCYAEAIKYTKNPTTLVTALRASAVVKAKEGYRKQALKDLEAHLPLIRYADPVAYHVYLNSYAVELAEAGRIEEAQNVCRIVLASPFTFAYPEYRETGMEIYLKAYRSRSSVPVIQSFFKPEKIQNEKIQNVLSFPERNTAPVRLRSKPAKVLDLQAWRAKMAEEERDEIPPDADEGDLYLRLMELIALKDLNAWELRQVIDFVEKLRPKESKN